LKKEEKKKKEKQHSFSSRGKGTTAAPGLAGRKGGGLGFPTFFMKGTGFENAQ